MDVVYPLGTGSNWNNNEIMYSLRSVEKYGLNVGNVFVIGERTRLDVTHIPYVETGTPAVNTWAKVLIAAADERISDPFLWFNDDIYMLQRFDANHYPYYHKGDISERNYQPTGRMYQRTMHETLKALRARGLSTLHYGVHCPFTVEKEKLLAMDREFGNIGISFRCAYGNMHNVASRRATDRKTRLPKRIKEWVGTAPFFSTRANLRGDAAKPVMNEIYPIRSRWEIGC